MTFAAWFLLLSVGNQAPKPRPSSVKTAAENVRRAVEPRDFFLYGCVREYAKAQTLPLYDSSTGYVVEYGGMSPEEMSRIYDAAKAFASTLRTPDLSDEDHGGVAVMAQCLEEARSSRIDALLRKPRSHKE
jgi:hypothetical protein